MAYNKETGMYEGYIYSITNTINGKQYVGQTSRTIEIRAYEHFLCNDNYPIHLAIQKYGKNNFTVDELYFAEFEDLECLFADLDENEIYYISKLNSKKNGYNYTLGGKGVTKLETSKKEVFMYDTEGNFISSFKSARDAADTINCNQGNIVIACKEYKEYRRVCNYIFRYSETPLTDIDIENIKLKYPKYYKYDFSGNLLDVFDCLLSAKNHLNTLYNSDIGVNISTAATHNGMSCGGFIWRKYPDKFNTYKLPSFDKNNPKKVEQRDMYTGELIAVFENCANVEKEIGFDAACIGNCCNKNDGYTQSYGYYWCYEGEFDLKQFNTDKSKYHQKRVKQFTINGKYITTFPKIIDAAISVNGDFSKIAEVCKGRRKTAYGYVWRFSDDEFNKYDSHTNKFRKINAYTLDQKYITTFNSAIEAKKYFGFHDHTTIYLCCKHKKKTSQGYKWFYADDSTQPDKTKIIDMREASCQNMS